MKITTIRKISLFAMLTFSTWAFAETPKPEGCPSVSAIQKVGIKIVRRMPDKTWAVGVKSDPFTTQEQWSFAIGYINAETAQEAKSIGQTLLKTISLQRGPIHANPRDAWACVYQYDNVDGNIALAMTPPIQF